MKWVYCVDEGILQKFKVGFSRWCKWNIEYWQKKVKNPMWEGCGNVCMYRRWKEVKWFSKLNFTEETKK